MHWTVRRYLIGPATKLKTLLRDPDSFFSNKRNKRGLALEGLIIFLIGCVGAIGVAYGGQQAYAGLDGEFSFVRFGLIGLVVRAILFWVGAWIAYSVLLHMLARLYNGSGPISRILKLSAWGFIPIAIANALHSGVQYFAYQDVNWPQGPPDPAPQVAAAELIGMGDDLLLAVSELLLIPFLLWTGYLLVHATKHAKQISQEAARKVVGVLIGFHILWIIWVAIGHLDVL